MCDKCKNCTCEKVDPMYREDLIRYIERCLRYYSDEELEKVYKFAAKVLGEK